jgi:putative CocE/NonD family hydrolase
VRHEREWPLARTQWRELHLHQGGRLADAAPSAAGAVAFHAPDGQVRFAWTVDEALELSGPFALRLAVELAGGSDCSLFVALEKWRRGRYAPFEGSYGFGRDHVSSGWLKLSHRALEAAASRPFAPVHTHTDPAPVRPGEVVIAEISLLPSSTRFDAGDEVRLAIRGHWPWSRNPLTGQFPAAYEQSAGATVVLHLGGESPARLLVPAIATAR